MTPKCRSVLEKASAKLDGAPVLYATEYNRTDSRIPGLGAVTQKLSVGIPNEGWIAVTDQGLAVFTRRITGLGGHKGTIPNELLASVSVQHAKKPGRATIAMTFGDGSSAELFAKTKDTYEALSPWIQGRLENATSPLGTPAGLAPDAPDERLFDMDAIFETNPGLSSSH